MGHWLVGGRWAAWSNGHCLDERTLGMLPRFSRQRRAARTLDDLRSDISVTGTQIDVASCRW